MTRKENGAESSSSSSSDIESDSYSKVNIDTLFLADKVRALKEKIRKNPWYRIDIYWKLNKELKELEKEADKIGERLNRLRTNPTIEIVKRP